MKIVINAKTGLPEIQLGVTLKSALPTNTLVNVNNKNYKLVNVEFTDVKGNKQQASAAIYEGNYSKGELSVGSVYAATARKTEEGVIYLQMSHLPHGAGLATADMFPEFVAENGIVMPFVTHSAFS